MLKFIVPVYLLFIFAMFCWEKLPNKQELVFASDVTHADTLSSGRVPEALRQEFTAKEMTLPVALDVASDAPNGPWTLRDQEGTPLFVLQRERAAEAGNKEVLSVKEYKFGYVSTIARNRVALSSVAFIATVLVFLLVLVHIAGRRWSAEGRYDNI
jgi:hypothetical protein